jgi:hypothetical protein
MRRGGRGAVAGEAAEREDIYLSSLLDWCVWPDVCWLQRLRLLCPRNFRDRYTSVHGHALDCQSTSTSCVECGAPAQAARHLAQLVYVSGRRAPLFVVNLARSSAPPSRSRICDHKSDGTSCVGCGAPAQAARHPAPLLCASGCRGQLFAENVSRRSAPPSRLRICDHESAGTSCGGCGAPAQAARHPAPLLCASGCRGPLFAENLARRLSQHRRLNCIVRSSTHSARHDCWLSQPARAWDSLTLGEL